MTPEEIAEIRDGLTAHREYCDGTKFCEQYGCRTVERLLAALAASEQRQQSGYYKTGFSIIKTAEIDALRAQLQASEREVAILSVPPSVQRFRDLEAKLEASERALDEARKQVLAREGAIRLEMEKTYASERALERVREALLKAGEQGIWEVAERVSDWPAGYCAGANTVTAIFRAALAGPGSPQEKGE